MQFGSKVKRNFWSAALLGLIPDILISAAAALVGADGSIFFVVLIGLQVVYFLIWLKNTIWAWAVFLRSGRKKLKQHFFDYLIKNHYPEPEDYLDSPEAYFLSVSNNESVATPLRVKAAIELGGLSVFAPSGYFQHSMRIAMAMEDAIEDYKRTFGSSNRIEVGSSS